MEFKWYGIKGGNLLQRGQEITEAPQLKLINRDDKE
jgi:hypothetical protein